MLFDLLLLPLLGGFVFIRLFRLTQYPTSRLSRQRLIIWAALAGVVGIVLSRTIVLLLLKIEPQAAVWWSFVLPFPLSGTAFGAFLIGCVVWYPANLLTNQKKALDWTTRRYGSQVEILFAETFKNRKQVQVTLEGGKVFVGYVIWQPLEPHKDNSYIGLLPTLSGYRETESKRVNFTTNYVETYEALKQENKHIIDNLDDYDFIKYFPMSAINIVSVFDPHIYMSWKR